MCYPCPAAGHRTACTRPRRSRSERLHRSKGQLRGSSGPLYFNCKDTSKPAVCPFTMSTPSSQAAWSLLSLRLRVLFQSNLQARECAHPRELQQLGWQLQGFMGLQMFYWLTQVAGSEFAGGSCYRGFLATVCQLMVPEPACRSAATHKSEVPVEHHPCCPHAAFSGSDQQQTSRTPGTPPGPAPQSLRDVVDATCSENRRYCRLDFVVVHL